jgi:AcrR family transcriptional regulator
VGRTASTTGTIVAAASAIVERREYELPSMAEIAREAGVTRPTVYAYFDNNLAVFSALVAQVRDRVLRIQEEADTSSLAATLRSTLIATLDLQVEHYGLFTVLADQARLRPEIRVLWHDIHDRPLRRHARFIDRLAALGQADPVAPSSVIAETIDGASLRFAQLLTVNPRRHDDLAASLLDMQRRLLGLATTDRRIAPGA